MSRCIHGGNVWEVSKKLNVKFQDVTDFSANINPLGPSIEVIEAIKNNLSCIDHYPEPYAEELVSLLSAYFNINKNSLIVGNGAMEVLFALIRSIEPKQVVLPVPTFSGYKEAIGDNCEIKYIYSGSDGDMGLNVDEIKLTMLKANVVFLCNPNNPTGHLSSRELLLDIIEHGKKTDTLVVVDESFIEFVDDLEEYTLKPFISKYDNLIVLQSMTKFFAIPGLRLGLAIANPEIIKKVQKFIPPWSVNTLAQAAGIAAIKDSDYINKTCIYVKEQRDFLYKELKKLTGFKVYKPNANFILINCEDTQKTAEMWQKLLFPHNIMIRNCNNFMGLNDFYFRVAVKSQKDNELLLNSIKEYI